MTVAITESDLVNGALDLDPHPMRKIGELLNLPLLDGDEKVLKDPNIANVRKTHRIARHASANGTVHATVEPNDLAGGGMV